VPVHHALDFVELTGYGAASDGGRTQSGGDQVRFLKDLTTEIEGRHVLLVDEVVDTGLTMNTLVRTLQLRRPASLAAALLFDRPYRRLVDDLPIRYVGFTLPDEFFVGYGFDLDERWRNLPDLRLLQES
jgi:hypoxanthine phosphoribosyltransferase